MKKNNSADLSLFLLIAKIGKTRGLKGEFFLRSYAENSQTLFFVQKFLCSVILGYGRSAF